ncbi:MAG: hypothetical protein HY975_02235, partial [Candidatus Kerfeldbacteria bacterium]|nr:hypothetical protein [Candidatus Kerfeldbacteria bacterium]
LQDWRLHANPTDGTNSPTALTDSNAIQVGALAAISVPETEIAYGSLALGADSATQTTTFQNVGNQVIDVTVQGTDMTSGSNTLVASQEKFHHTSSTFDWASGGGFSLTTTTPVAGNETNGCLNRDLAVRAVHGTGTEDEAIYWKLRVPSAQASGTYAGTTHVGSIASTACTGTLY